MGRDNIQTRRPSFKAVWSVAEQCAPSALSAPSCTLVVPNFFPLGDVNSTSRFSYLLQNVLLNSHNRSMTEKEIVLETIRALPDDCSLEEIAERIEFMAAIQKGLDQLDRGEGIPHDEVKRQLTSWLTS